MSIVPPHAPYRRRALFPAWLLAASVVLALLVATTLCPIGWRPHLANDPDEERFWAFFVLGLTAKFAAPRRHLPTLACVALLAIGSEAAQLLAPSRHARFSDGALKTLGAVAGVQMGYAFFKLRRGWQMLSAAKEQRAARGLPARS